MKKTKVVVGLGVIILLFYCGFYFKDRVGISEDKINAKQAETVSWNAQDYQTISASDNKSLYVGVMYMKDYSDAKYFIYVKRGGLYFGWHFLQSGGLTEIDGIRVFDCGKYGTAYVAMNKDNIVSRIEFEDGREASVMENIKGPICERSNTAVHFYDALGNVIEPTTRWTLRQ
ncbi:hypothetical protein EII17_08105 [Clostridiales bacterium COT073_COT-073]|nr:hypothetical protein EII17_08105 [Clostridiales bacterium COT073_COT-073]